MTIPGGVRALCVSRKIAACGGIPQEPRRALPDGRARDRTEAWAPARAARGGWAGRPGRRCPARRRPRRPDRRRDIHQPRPHLTAACIPCRSSQWARAENGEVLLGAGTVGRHLGGDAVLLFFGATLLGQQESDREADHQQTGLDDQHAVEAAGATGRRSVVAAPPRADRSQHTPDAAACGNAVSGAPIQHRSSTVQVHPAHPARATATKAVAVAPGTRCVHMRHSVRLGA